jgi:hypothetical protein
MAARDLAQVAWRAAMSALWAVAILTAVSACHAPAEPSSAPAGTDVLDFMIGNPQTWPRVGSHSQNQVVDAAKREVCWVKYANPRTFECWRWDEDFVYHVVDHAIDGNTGESYRFDDGRWMPRRIAGDWQLTVDTRITWFDPSCRIETERSGRYAYHQRTWLEPSRALGGDLGTHRVLILEYAPVDPAGGPGAPEHFYFGEGVGWFAWERGDAQRTFARIGGPAMSVAQDVRCP